MWKEWLTALPFGDEIFYGEEAASFPLGHYATNVTFTHHRSPCGSIVRVSHWSSEGYRLYTYVTFTYHLSPCGSMVKLSHWSSEGYRLYTYVVQFIFYILHLLLQHLTVYQNITHRFTYIYLFTQPNRSQQISKGSVSQKHFLTCGWVSLIYLSLF